MVGRTRLQEILLTLTCIFCATARSAAQLKQATIELYLSNSTLDDYPDREDANTAVSIWQSQRSSNDNRSFESAIAGHRVFIMVPELPEANPVDLFPTSSSVTLMLEACNE